MKIAIIRHGAPENEGYADETLRPLSEEGKQGIASLATHLIALPLIPDLILSSPLIRAEQTADILSEQLGGKAESCEALGYDFDPTALLHLMQQQPVESTLFLVGHENFLSDFIALLTGIPREGHLHKGCGVVISFADTPDFGKGVEEYSIQP